MLIPRLIHQIWLGTQPFPDEYARYRQTWHAAHPEWELRLWTDADLAELPLRNRDLLRTVRTESERSDVLRYELLYEFGGVYVDADFECLRPLDRLIADESFFAGADCFAYVINTGLMGAVPGHPFLDEVIRELPGHLADCGVRQVTHPNYTVGPWFFSRLVHRGTPPDLCVFPTRVFYPYGWYELERRDEDFRATSPGSYAAHHWSFSWDRDQPRTTARPRDAGLAPK